MATWTHSTTRVLCAILTAIPLLFGSLRAQEAPHLERGTRIRFSSQVLDAHLSGANATGGVNRDVHMAYVRARRVNATVLSSDADTVVVRLSRGGSQLSIPWESFEWMEKRGSRTRATVISTLVGAAVVGANLAYIGADAWAEEICEFMGPNCWPNPNRSPAEQAVEYGLIGAVLGGGIGFAIGASGALDRWKPVPVSGRVALMPRRDHLGISASVRF